MSGVQAVAPVSSTTSSDPATAPASAELANAFAQGIVQFMGTMIQSTEGDIQEACNDTTSDPDALS